MTDYPVEIPDLPPEQHLDRPVSVLEPLSRIRWPKVSVTKNRMFAAGYHRARRVGLDVFAPQARRTLRTALTLRDLHEPRAAPSSPDRGRPEELIGSGALHGGDWCRRNSLRSTLIYTGIDGLPEAYAPKLR
jgi:hypothetical protein